MATIAGDRVSSIGVSVDTQADLVLGRNRWRTAVDRVSDGYEVSDGSNVVMLLRYAQYGALYQTSLVEHVVQLAKVNDVPTAWKVVEEATTLADSLQCPWCQLLGLHEECWTPGTRESI